MTPHDTPDSHLPQLTGAQADRLRALVTDDLRARSGALPTVVGDTALSEGHRHPLTNLAQRCRVTPEDEWPAMVEEHFARLSRSSAGGESAEELLERTVLRLVPPGTVPAEAADGYTYLRGVAEGLNLALALDAPTSVRLLTDADVERAGADALWAAAERNLVREPVRHEEVRLDGHPVLYSVYGDSPFVSTKALILPELIAEATGRRMPMAGALVVVPTRHLLAFHPIVDGSAVDAVNDLATYAVKAHEDGPGSLSPRVYWWHDGRLTTLTVIDHETRTFSQQPPAGLLAVLRSMRALDRAGRLVTAARDTEVPRLSDATVALLDAAAVAPDRLPDAFASAVTLAHARAADDPRASLLESWDAWVIAALLGTALFAGTKEVTTLFEEREVTVPATGPGVRGDARAWLDAFYVSLVTRERARTQALCEVPLDALRGSGPDATPVDDHVLHFVDTLQSYWLHRPVDDVVAKLAAAMDASYPEKATLAPKDFVNHVEYQPIALFHRLLTQEHDKFSAALAQALEDHARYWGDSTAPRSRVALGPLALACLAYDMEFPVGTDHDRLPRYLLDRSRLEVIPGSLADG
ncbi:immunity 49 family protein [Streptomyces sp. VRA16 Mangrove soil]|uniref:immunity 49 family protein n=1 Tax=Streptomyces sp. VRA16 Mangrove soil TaxID=2817434 RepID=UPI001A9DF3AF|nr:immunity 49 family protein [Streptomyces sp. VRA16 Mangrove soil]MBO1331906.1 immunity 49 family protein [Streptomyces sp. VRA16 Mangrove soil]